jgi:hypothetical protein
MAYSLLSDIVVLVHLAFALFALLGGTLALRWPPLMRLHLPVLVWGIVVEWADWICPLTPLENSLRQLAGEAGYSGGFIEHVLSPLLYPEDLTLQLRYLIALLLIAVNGPVYVYLLLIKRRRST